MGENAFAGNLLAIAGRGGIIRGGLFWNGEGRNEKTGKPNRCQCAKWVIVRLRAVTNQLPADDPKTMKTTGVNSIKCLTPLVLSIKCLTPLVLLSKIKMQKSKLWNAADGILG